MAVILDHGARAMMEEQKDEFYYITAMNENYAQPSMPEGGRRTSSRASTSWRRTQRRRARRACASSVRGDRAEVVEAAKMRMEDWGVGSEVFSATSYSQLACDAREAERHNRLNPLAEPQGLALWPPPCRAMCR